ncbi:hypothetical protein AAVH_19538 [Aphelenchoides avenae]|nr:hypothetical protein AAVH_19538 [Aphelenchus avenae]
MPMRLCGKLPNEFLTTYPGRILLLEFLVAVVCLCALANLGVFKRGFRLHIGRAVVVVLVVLAFLDRKPLLLLPYMGLKLCDIVILIHFLAKLTCMSPENRAHMLLEDKTLVSWWKAIVVVLLLVLAVNVGFGYAFCVTYECLMRLQ